MLRAILAAVVIWSVALAAQQGLVLQQLRDRDRPEPLTTGVRPDDPFFNLVLAKGSPKTLTAIEEAIQPDARSRVMFVVSERLAESKDGVRRAVIAFRGSNAGIPLTGNVFLSVFFNSSGFDEDVEAVEVVAWDTTNRSYNYYKLEDDRGERKWTFRGSSAGAERLSATERAGTCFQCHINGAPIMKELLFPWNNWVSGQFEAAYLVRGRADAWPVASNTRMASLGGAEALEGLVLDSIRRFNRTRVESTIGLMPLLGERTVAGGQQLLRPLFVTTEFNIISSAARSGLHPMGPKQPGNASVTVPGSSLVNVDLFSGGGIAGYRGLGGTAAARFRRLIELSADEYARLVNETGTTLDGRPGDTVFAWFASEPSHIDNHYIDLLIAEQIIPATFAAAIQAVDFKTPVLSARRASLLKYVPENFSVGTAAAREAFVRDFVARVRASNPVEGSAEAEVLAILESADPIAAVNARLNAYAEEIVSGLKLDRMGTLRKHFDRLLKTRRAVLDDPTLGGLDETRGLLLFPLPRR